MVDAAPSVRSVERSAACTHHGLFLREWRLTLLSTATTGNRSKEVPDECHRWPPSFKARRREQLSNAAFAAALRQIAVIAHMDVRFDVHRALRFSGGQAHVFDNLGGVDTAMGRSLPVRRTDGN